MRKTIAQRMVQAKQTAPEIHVTADIRVDKLVAIREDLNRQLAAEKVKLSLGDFVTKAVAMALRRHPGAERHASSPTRSSATARSTSASPSPSMRA